MQRTSHGIPGHARHYGNARHRWSYSSVTQLLHPSFRSCKGEHPRPLPLLTPPHCLPCRACKWGLRPTANPRSAHHITRSSPDCPHHMRACPQGTPGTTTAHDIETLSSSPAALPLLAHPWHHSPASTGLPPWLVERWLIWGGSTEVGSCRGQGIRERNGEREN